MNLTTFRQVLQNPTSSVGASLASAKAALSTFTTQRIEHMTEMFEVVDDVADGLEDFGRAIPDAVMNKLLAMRYIDDDGMIHGFIKTGIPLSPGYDDYVTLDYNPVLHDTVPENVIAFGRPEGQAYWVVYSDYAATTLLPTFFSLVTEGSINSSVYMQFISSCITGSTAKGTIDASLLSDGLSSVVEPVRRTAEELVSVAPEARFSALIQLLSDQFSEIQGGGTSQEQDVEGYFDVSQYELPTTKGTLLGMWSLISGAASAIATVLLIIGQGVFAALGVLMTVGVTIYNTVKDMTDAQVEYTYGDGSNDYFAQALVRYIPVAWIGACEPVNGRATQPLEQMRIITPMGAILIQRVKPGDTQLKFLIYCSTSLAYGYGMPLLNVGPYASDWVGEFGWYPTQNAIQHHYDDIASKVSQSLSGGDYCRVSDHDQHLFGAGDIARNVCANLGALTWFMITRGMMALPDRRVRLIQIQDYWNYERGGEDVLTRRIPSAINSYLDTYYPLRDPGVPNPERWRAQCFLYGYENSTTSFPVEESEDYVWASLTALFSNPQSEFTFGVYGQLLADMFHVIRNSISSTFSDDILCQALGAFFGTYSPAVVRGEPTLCAYTRSEVVDFAIHPEWCVPNVCDPLAVGDNLPAIEPSPWITPPKVSKRSVVMSVAVVIGFTATAATVALLARRKIRMWARGRCLRAEADAIKAQDAVKLDPSTQNLKACLKAQRKFARWSRWSGYSSNSVGTFSVTSGSSIITSERLVSRLTPQQIGTFSVTSGSSIITSERLVSRLTPQQIEDASDADLIYMALTGHMIGEVRNT